MTRRFPVQLAINVGHPTTIAAEPCGKLVETGLVIASRDFISADAVEARLLELHPQAVRHVFEVGRQGLGQADLSQIQTLGPSIHQAICISTNKASGRAVRFDHP
jgi:uncharacterized protein (DUF362 family)